MVFIIIHVKKQFLLLNICFGNNNFFSGFFNELKVRKKQHLFETDLLYTVKKYCWFNLKKIGNLVALKF